MTQTLNLLLAVTLGAGLLAVGALAGARVAGRPLRATERRLDRALAISEAERSRLLALLLAKDPMHLQILQATSPAPAPPADRTLGGPPEPAAAWESGEYTPDPNELSEWDAVDDAAFRTAR